MSPTRRGPRGEFDKRTWAALKGAYITYLKLEQATSKKQSSIKNLSLLVNGCVNKAGFTKTRDDLTRKLKTLQCRQSQCGGAEASDVDNIIQPWSLVRHLESNHY
jgi:hypothetical protein